jgi:hypothetical protein
MSKNIRVRNFKGSSVPVGSKMGRILINSKDSKAVVSAIRASVKGNVNSITLSKGTLSSLELAKAK